MQWSFTHYGPLRADVELSSGSIEVRPLTGESIEVSLEAVDPGSHRAAELIEASEVRLDGDTLTVHVPAKPFKSFRQAEIRCVLTLPAGSDLEAKSASADITCPVSLGSFSGATASGDAILGDIAGDADFKAASGDLRCSEVGGRLNVKAASGDVAVGHVAGDVEVAVASGDVEIGEADSSVKVTTASGDAKLGKVHSGKISVTSASGDAVIGLAQGTGAHLDVSSITGEVSCDLPMGEHEASPAAVRIKCATMSGDIRILSAA